MKRASLVKTLEVIFVIIKCVEDAAEIKHFQKIQNARVNIFIQIA